MRSSTGQPTLDALRDFEPPRIEPSAAAGARSPAGGRWHPELLLSLVDPQRQAANPPKLFAGEERFLSRGKLAKRIRFQELVQEAFDRVCEDGEHLLYVTPAVAVPPMLHLLGFGAWWVYYHQVALLFTDRRLVEVELGPRGRGLGTRVRSLRWGEASRLRLRGRTLEVRGARRSRQRWSVRLRGDRKLLKQLVPRIAEEWVGTSPAEPALVSHCPSCGHAERKMGLECTQCGTRFRSRRLAAGLSLAFPGGGLYFAGHPFLAFFDFMGEMALYALGCAMVLQSADAVELTASVAVFGFFLFLTKIESVHLASVLVERTKPLDPGRAAAWRRFAVAGAVLSVAALALPLSFAGHWAPAVERDLELAAGSEWQVSRSSADWVGDAQDKRAEWYGPEGQVVEVRAYPLSSLETFEDFATTFGAELEAPLEPFQAASLTGYSAVEHLNLGGETFDRVIFAIYDPEFHDVHIVTLDSQTGGGEEASREVQDLLLAGRWVGTAPTVVADGDL